MALVADGTLWGWGKNEKGQLGLGNSTSITEPVKLTLPVTSKVVLKVRPFWRLPNARAAWPLLF